MKNNYVMFFLIVVSLGMASVAQGESVSIAELMRVAKPIAPENAAACTGITFTNPPDEGMCLSVVFSFSNGSVNGTGCNGSAIGGQKIYSNVPLTGAEVNQTYCIDAVGLSILSDLIGAGSPATCVMLQDEFGNLSTEAQNVTCSGTGDCIYNGTNTGTITLGEGLCSS